LCTLSDSSSGTYHYYNYNKACDYLCNDNDKEKMILVKFKLSSTKTCTRILTLPPCTDITTCCKQVKEENVDVIVNPGNDAGETCCFKFNFNDISCNISKINIYKDSGRANYITSIYTKNIDLSNLSDNMGWLCLHNFVHDTLLKIYFALVDSNGTECIHLQPVDIPVCYSCCEHVHATVTSTPDYDDGTKCCFTAEVWADSNKLCPGLAKIEIVRTSDSFSIAKQQIEFNQFDIAYFDFCVGKSVFDSMASLPIIVRCEALDGTILCEYPATIDSCTMPTLCTPDYPLTGWKHNLKPDTLSIGCDTISNCHVVINYSYRLVRDSITNQIKWRDIEVTSFDFDPTCADTNCQNELVEKILAHIWNNKDVTDVFLFNPGGWGNDTIRCFDNLRVISSDCFKSYMPLSDPIDYTSICESTTCCYAIFHTCYKRDAFNNLTNLPDSTKQSEFYKVPVNCPSGCVSGNCGKWNVYGNHASGIIQQTEVIENIFKNNLCNVILKSDNTHTTYSLDLECELNGIIHIELFDLLGNTILSKDVDKTGYKITIPVEILLNSGVYLIRVNIDGTLLFYNKFNIIK